MKNYLLAILYFAFLFLIVLLEIAVKLSIIALPFVLIYFIVNAL